jgi:phosphomannomutase
MVTGSHIPSDRNGLKFFSRQGEISKTDENRIASALTKGVLSAPKRGAFTMQSTARAEYIDRYTSAFGPQALAGLRLGVYQHSTVARDVLVDILAGLGATVVPLGRLDSFVAVDTEAVDEGTRVQLGLWVIRERLDAILSADGDADRPMLTDGTGKLVAGDILGTLTALSFKVDIICTPVSSNSMIADLDAFSAVHLTRIGSPFVVSAMCEAQAADGSARVAGFEPNGGFLLGFDAQGPAGRLAALPTRDACLPLIAPLVWARNMGTTVSKMIAGLPQRYTAADRLNGIASDSAKSWLDRLLHEQVVRAAFLAPLGQEIGLDRTDGLRVHLDGGRVVHLRPSGNSPEFRVYVEAETEERAATLLKKSLTLVAKALCE